VTATDNFREVDFIGKRLNVSRGEKRFVYIVGKRIKIGTMQQLKEHVIKARPVEDRDAINLEWIERIARWLDSRFYIPGTNIRFGLDPIMSLFPVVGDLATFVISGMLVYNMYQHGVSRNVVIKMILNSTLDAIIGMIPLVGTFFDVFYRANDRNVRLLKEHYFEGKHHGSGNGILAVVAISAVVAVVGSFYGLYKLFEAIF